MIFRHPCPRRPWKPESVSRREQLVSTRGLAYHGPGMALAASEVVLTSRLRGFAVIVISERAVG